MQLRYAYISEYKNIHKQGFNFSSEYRFSYNPDGELLSVDDRREKVIKGFFNENYTSITAIVGENGVGKSNLIEWLLRNLASFANGNFYSYPGLSQVIIILDQVIFKTPDLQINNQEDLEAQGFEIREYTESLHEGYEYLLRALSTIRNQYIYFSHAFDFRSIEDRLPNLHDISTNELISRDRFYSVAGQESNSFQSIRSFADQEVTRHLDFITANIQNIPFPLPKIIHYEFPSILENRFLNRTSEFQESLRELNVNTYIDDLFVNFNYPVDSRLEKLRQIISCCLFRSLMVSFPDEFINNPPDYNFFSGWVYERNYPRLGSGDLLNGFERAQETLQILDQLIDTSTYYLSTRNRTDYYPERSEWEVSNKISFVVDENSIELIRQFHQNMREATGDKPIALNSWGQMSTGERNLLNLFSRLYALRNKIDPDFVGYKGPSNFVIFLDEGSSGSHPDWQKEYFNILYEFLPKVLCDNNLPVFKDSTIQLILTSHSPFVISNLPNENIIFLKKNEEGLCQVVDSLNEMKQTFGANIHTLLSDSFFLNGLIGNFAKNKIDETIKYLEGEGEMTYEEAHKTVELIGEPIIQKYLKDGLKKQDYLNRISSLQARIAELEDGDNLAEND